MKKSQQQGFTVVELLITLVILSILVSVAAPSYQRMIAQQKLRGASTELRASLLLTRAEAVKIGQTASMQPKLSDWNKGWEVVSDGNVVGDFALPEGVSVAAGPASGKVKYTLWGRPNSQCEHFDLTVSGCNMCLYLDIDGSVFTDTGACSASCPAAPESANNWVKACSQ